MKNQISFAALALGATISLTARAADPAWTTNWGIITRIESFGDDFHVAGPDFAPNPAGCSTTSLAKVQYSLTLAKKEGLGRTLTSAFLSGRQVKLRLAGTCEGTNPAIYGVQVK
jgi:hypothetical protein